MRSNFESGVSINRLVQQLTTALVPHHPLSGRFRCPPTEECLSNRSAEGSARRTCRRDKENQGVQRNERARERCGEAETVTQCGAIPASRILKVVARCVLASPRGSTGGEVSRSSETLEGMFHSPKRIPRRTARTKCRLYLLASSLAAACGTTRLKTSWHSELRGGVPN